MASTYSDPPFLRVPPEIRLRIYEEYLRLTVPAPKFYDDLIYFREPELGLVCWSIRVECLPPFYNYIRPQLSTIRAVVDREGNFHDPDITVPLTAFRQLNMRLITKLQLYAWFGTGLSFVDRMFCIDLHPKTNTYTLSSYSPLQRDVHGDDPDERELRFKQQRYMHALELQLKKVLDDLMDDPGAGNFGPSHLARLSCIIRTTFFPGQPAADWLSGRKVMWSQWSQTNPELPSMTTSQ